MKKYKRLLSLVCAVCMALSLVIPASAADVSSENQISAFAGETMTCKIVVAQPEGEDEVYTVDVAVPENATVAEQSALTIAAANSVANVPMTRYAGRDLISDWGIRTLPHSVPGQLGGIGVGGGILHDNYHYIYMEFQNISSYTGATKINVRVEDDQADTKNVYTYKEIAPGNADTMLYMYANRIYGGGSIPLTYGDSIVVFASVDTGNITCNCVVSATA